VTDPGDAHDVGSLGDEAAKLLGALSGWARDHASEAGDGLSGLASHAASAVHGIDEHLATGSAECTVCPLCRTVHAVRQLNPEVHAHLASALTSLAQAFSAVMATPSTESRGDVEHIDISDEWPEHE
jgi:hypothetical protein